MAYSVKQGDIFGRIGTGFGKGLAEQVPKEMERNRLASGLRQLGQQKGLDPFEKFSGLVGLAHDNPQVLQSGERIINQQARGQALADLSNQSKPPQPSPFPIQAASPQGQQVSQVPSITKGELLEDVQRGYIPPSEEERLQEAARDYQANPALFGHDPQKAIDRVDKKVSTEERRDLARTEQHKRLTDIQDNIVKRLVDQSNRLNVQIPADLYSEIENDAIEATKPKKDGGRGLSEQQAMKEYGDKLNNASREFAKIDEISGWGILSRPASNTLRPIQGIQKAMEKMGQTDNMAKKLITKHNISPTLAYAQSQPVHRAPALNSALKELPELEKAETLFETLTPPYISVPSTVLIAPRIAKLLKDKKASPLAAAYELQKKGYDAETFLQYVTDHPELDLTQRQMEQAGTPINPYGTLNDFWLKSFSGIE